MTERVREAVGSGIWKAAETEGVRYFGVDPSLPFLAPGLLRRRRRWVCFEESE